MAIVWGNKTFSDKGEATALNCPCCGEKVIADEMILKKSWHIYYISYKTMELGRYARCRFCGFCAELPPSAKPQKIDNDTFIARDEIINQTNPTMHGRTAQAIGGFPKGMSRRDWAILMAR